MCGTAGTGVARCSAQSACRLGIVVWKRHEMAVLRGRPRLGPAEQKALHVVDPEIHHQIQLTGILDAFGDDLRAGGAPDIDDRSQDLRTHRILLGAADEIAIDFHELRRIADHDLSPEEPTPRSSMAISQPSARSGRTASAS